jgi:hypothetical protein
MNCNTCDIEFEPIEFMPENSNQADGCAATLYLYDGTYYILAHYGSKYDMQRYALKKVSKYVTGNICDKCIERFINAGAASLIEDGVW